MFANAKKRSRRLNWPIAGYVGPNGSGKTCMAVWDSLPALMEGRPVLSTVRLLDFANPRPCEGFRTAGAFDAFAGDPDDPGVWTFETVDCELCGTGRSHGQAHPFWLPFREWRDLMFAGKCDALMDEVTGVASSRESQSLPAPVANALVQMRRRDIVIRWTAPAWARADKIIRECSQVVNNCTGYLPKEARSGEGELVRRWRTRRLFRVTTYDATLFEDFTSGKREQLGPLLRDWHYGPWSPAFKAYDTLDAVLSIGTVTDAGRCYDCGGSRKAPECSCGEYQDRLVVELERGAGRRASAGRARTGGSHRHGGPDSIPG